MKRWKFSLEVVRSLKRRLEEEAAQKHARALMNQAHQKTLLSDTEQQLRAAAESCGRQRKNSAAELLQINQYITVLEQQRKERQEACREAEKQVALARAHLETVAREREVLDRLHDRRKAEHEFHVARQEQKWLDEMAQRVKRGLLSPAT